MTLIKPHTINRVRFIKNADKTWSVCVPTAYGRRTINTGLTDKAAARDMVIRAKIRERIAVRFERRVVAAFTSPHKATFKLSLEEWVENLRDKVAPATVAMYQAHTMSWLKKRKLVNEPPSAASEEDVKAWVNDHTSVKLATRNVRLSILSMFFDWLCAKGYSIGNPARAVGKVSHSHLSHEQKEPKKTIPFTLDEIARIIAHCDDRIAYEHRQWQQVQEVGVETGYDNLKRIDWLRFWKTMTIISRYTGLRLGDATCLEWASVSTESIIVWTDKRDARVVLPMWPEILTALAEYIRKPGQQFIFWEQAILYRQRHVRELTGRFKKLLRAMGIEGKSFRSTRATCAIDMKERLITAGHSERDAIEMVAKLLGHASSVTTVNHYLNNKQTNEQTKQAVQ